MADTLLAKKAGGADNAVATDDSHHDTMANDPTISSFHTKTSGVGWFSGFW